MKGALSGHTPMKNLMGSEPVSIRQPNRGDIDYDDIPRSRRTAMASKTQPLSSTSSQKATSILADDSRLFLPSFTHKPSWTLSDAVQKKLELIPFPFTHASSPPIPVQTWQYSQGHMST